jgi:hypothetical protein
LKIKGDLLDKAIENSIKVSEMARETAKEMKEAMF